ncbi:hypothetical protein [Streptomyces sp. NPDC058644]|uniref:hypothetical protein n=1 Tax=unclassified Streptomyces TaxID=2593676 RepID=UPI003652B6AA
MSHPAPSGPPPKHHMALMIWMSVFPTLTVLELLLHTWLARLPMVLQTLVLSALVVPAVVYVLMPRLHRVRGKLLARRTLKGMA